MTAILKQLAPIAVIPPSPKKIAWMMSAIETASMAAHGPSTTAAFTLGAEPKSGTLSPTELGIPFASLEDLKGGDKNQNAAMIRTIFEGQERGRKRDAVILNAAAALHLLMGVTLAEAVKRADEVIDSGAAIAKLNSLRR